MKALFSGAIAGAIEGAIFRFYMLVAGTIAGAIEGAVFRRHLLVAGAVSQAPLEALVAGAIRGAIFVPFEVRFRHHFSGSSKVPFQALIQRS